MKSILALTMVIMVALSSGCRIITPTIQQSYSNRQIKGTNSVIRVDENGNRIPPAVDLGHARLYAEDIINEISDIRDAQIKFKFGSGATLAATGIAATGLGLYDGSDDAILGTALGSGLIAGSMAFIPVTERIKILNDGIDSIGKLVVALDEKTPEISTSATEMNTLAAQQTVPKAIFHTLNSQLSASISSESVGLAEFNSLLKADTKYGTLLFNRVTDIDNTLSKLNSDLSSLKARTTTNDVEKARKLINGVDAIVYAINSQLAGLGYDPEAAKSAAESVIKPKDEADAEQANEVLMKLHEAEILVKMSHEFLNLSLLDSDKISNKSEVYQGVSTVFSAIQKNIEMAKAQLRAQLAHFEWREKLFRTPSQTIIYGIKEK